MGTRVVDVSGRRFVSVLKRTPKGKVIPEYTQEISPDDPSELIQVAKELRDKQEAAKAPA